MNFDYSDDQKFLKDEARKFLEQRSSPAVARGVLNDPDKSYDSDLWRAVAEMGWLGAAIPEEYGGLGLGRIELCAIAEELGRVGAPIPFASSVYFAAEALMLAGDDKMKAFLLPKVASGEWIGSFATSEGPGAVAAKSLKCEVEDGKLSGVKIPVTDGDVANFCVVLANEGGKAGLFVVNLTDAATVARETLKTVDPTRGAAKLTFTGAPATPLGDPGDGMLLMEQVFDRAAVFIAFEQLGGADKCLEMAKNYALERYAFGRVIASYQAIKHKLADMYVKNQVARSNAYYAAWALNTDAAELPIAAAAARVASTDAFWFGAKENIQTHGGMGFTWEVDCHLYFRRAQQLGLVAGASKVWKERLVSQLERRNAA